MVFEIKNIKRASSSRLNNLSHHLKEQTKHHTPIAMYKLTTPHANVFGRELIFNICQTLNRTSFITSKYYKMNESPPLESFLVNLKM